MKEIFQLLDRRLSWSLHNKHFWQRYIWRVSREYSRNTIDELELPLPSFINSNIRGINTLYYCHYYCHSSHGAFLSTWVKYHQFEIIELWNQFKILLFERG